MIKVYVYIIGDLWSRRLYYGVVWYYIKQKAGGGFIGGIIPVVEKHSRAEGARYEMYQGRQSYAWKEEPYGRRLAGQRLYHG